MGKKSSNYGKTGNVLNVLAPGAGAPLTGVESIKKKDEGKLASAEAAASENAAKAAEAQKQLDAAKEAEAQQEAVRKKMASLGRLQAGYTFSDGQAGTGATKVFS